MWDQGASTRQIAEALEISLRHARVLVARISGSPAEDNLREEAIRAASRQLGNAITIYKAGRAA